MLRPESVPQLYPALLFVGRAEKGGDIAIAVQQISLLKTVEDRRQSLAFVERLIPALALRHHVDVDGIVQAC